jgi:hypothetical protein
MDTIYQSAAGRDARLGLIEASANSYLMKEELADCPIPGILQS